MATGISPTGSAFVDDVFGFRSGNDDNAGATENENRPTQVQGGTSENSTGDEFVDIAFGFKDGDLPNQVSQPKIATGDWKETVRMVSGAQGASFLDLTESQTELSELISDGHWDDVGDLLPFLNQQKMVFEILSSSLMEILNARSKIIDGQKRLSIMV